MFSEAPNRSLVLLLVAALFIHLLYAYAVVDVFLPGPASSVSKDMLPASLPSRLTHHVVFILVANLDTNVFVNQLTEKWQTNERVFAPRDAYRSLVHAARLSGSTTWLLGSDRDGLASLGWLATRVSSLLTVPNPVHDSILERVDNSFAWLPSSLGQAHRWQTVEPNDQLLAIQKMTEFIQTSTIPLEDLNPALFHVHVDQDVFDMNQFAHLNTALLELIDAMNQRFPPDKITWVVAGGKDPTGNLSLPFVSWGAGISRSRTDWSWPPTWTILGVVPLLANLLGVHIPSKNLGMIPPNVLDVNRQSQVQRVCANARQVICFYRHRLIAPYSAQSIHRIVHEPLSDGRDAGLLGNAQRALQNGQVEQAFEICQHVYEEGLTGIDLLLQQDRNLLLTVIVFGLVGWMLLTCMHLWRHYTGVTVYHQFAEFVNQQSCGHHVGSDIWLNFLSLALMSLASYFLFRVQAPLSYYFYINMPIGLWMTVWKRRFILTDTFLYMRGHRSSVMWITTSIVTLLIAELIVSFFYQRFLVSICLAVLVVYPFTTELIITDKVTVGGWVVFTFILGIFPLIPLEHSPIAQYSGGLLAVILSLYSVMLPYFHVMPKSKQQIEGCARARRGTIFLTLFQCGILCLTMWLIYDSRHMLEFGHSLSFHKQALAWLILIVSPLIPIFASPYYLSRMLNVGLGFAAPYILLSISYEGLFLVSILGSCLYWFLIEHKLSPARNAFTAGITIGRVQKQTDRTETVRHLLRRDVRSAVFFLILFATALFSQGDLTSAFAPNPVVSYLLFGSSSYPVIYDALVVFKSLIPFILIACTFQAVTRTLSVPPMSLFLVVLVIADIVTLHFLFLVKVSGSWIDVDQSIIHYESMVLFVVLLALLFAISKIWIGPIHIPSRAKLRQVHLHDS